MQFCGSRAKVLRMFSMRDKGEKPEDLGAKFCHQRVVRGMQGSKCLAARNVTFAERLCVLSLGEVEELPWNQGHAGSRLDSVRLFGA